MNKVIIFILISIISLYITNVFIASRRHIEVMDKNKALEDSSVFLCSENEVLKNENDELKSDYLLLKMHFDSIYVADISKRANDENPFPESIISIEKTVKDFNGWTKPNLVYDMLSITLGRNPTKQEYKKAMSYLIKKHLVKYDAINDSLSPTIVKESEIDSLTNEYFNAK